MLLVRHKQGQRYQYYPSLLRNEPYGYSIIVLCYRRSTLTTHGKEETMGILDGKSAEQDAYERGQDIGAHGDTVTRAIISSSAALLPESQYEAWMAGYNNGLANPPKDDD